MSKYIDLKLALNKLWRLCEEDIDAELPEAFDFSRAREALIDLPTIDIVRCKECKHWDNRFGLTDTEGSCEYRGGKYNFTDADYYCASGEREEA